MINKRGKMMALIGGFVLLIVIVVDSMNTGGISKDSFYETFNTAGEKVSIGKKDRKKKASLKADEEDILQSSESYEKNVSNKKDKAFSLYAEILNDDDIDVIETVIEASEEETVELKKEEVTQAPRIVYVEKQVKTQVVEEKAVIQEPKERQFTRARAREEKSKVNSTTNIDSSEKYYRAEVFEEITVDMAYPPVIKIRLMEEATLPDGRLVAQNTLLKGVPSEGSSVLNISIPEYGLEVYDQINMKGIPLSGAEGFKREAEGLKRTEVSTTANIPLVGSVRLKSGTRNQSLKVDLQQNRTVYLKWKN